VIANNFTPVRLAQYIKLLAQNQTLYDSFFTWRKSPADTFKKIFKTRDPEATSDCGRCQRFWDFHS